MNLRPIDTTVSPAEFACTARPLNIMMRLAGLAHSGGFPVESLGARFKQERERKGITLDDVALSTKIGTRMLQALEEERYDQLPGGIFNKGFVRAYARHLGLDEEQAVADYVATTAPPLVEGEPVAVMEAMAAHAVETRGERLSPIDRIPWGKLAILLLLVAIVLTIWGPHPQQSEKHKGENVPHSSQPAHAPASVPRNQEHAAHASIPAALRRGTTGASTDAQPPWPALEMRVESQFC
jgi:cytoskeleton protein RodZ